MEANEVRVLKKNPDKITRLWFELIPDLWCEHREHGRRFVFLQCLLSHHRGFRIKTCSMLLPTFTTRGGYCSDPLVFFHLLITNGYFSPLIHLIWFAASGAIALNVLLGTMADDVAAAASSCHHLSLLPDVFSCGPAKVVFTLHGCSA